MLTIKTTYPSIQVEYHLPRADMNQKVTQIQIRGSGPRLEIDQKQSRNEIGMGGYQYLSRQIREQSYHQVLDGIARMVNEGDEIVDRAGLFQEEMIFADQAKKRMDAQIPELNIHVAPRTRPDIKFHYAQEITWDQGGTTIKHHVRPPTITWNMGGVDVNVRR